MGKYLKRVKSLKLRRFDFASRSICIYSMSVYQYSCCLVYKRDVHNLLRRQHCLIYMLFVYVRSKEQLTIYDGCAVSIAYCI